MSELPNWSDSIVDTVLRRLTPAQNGQLYRDAQRELDAFVARYPGRTRKRLCKIHDPLMLKVVSELATCSPRALSQKQWDFLVICTVNGALYPWGKRVGQRVLTLDLSTVQPGPPKQGTGLKLKLPKR